jgi:hypothetical protein
MSTQRSGVDRYPRKALVTGATSGIGRAVAGRPDDPTGVVCRLAPGVVGTVFGMHLSDLPCVEVSLTLAAAAELVWSLASDVTRVGVWGGECVEAAGGGCG